MSILVGLAVLILFVVIELLIVKFNGTNVPAPSIPRGQKTLGSGPKLTYVIMGDSTSIGQGTDYAQSFAMASVEHLADKYTVSFANTGISGAAAADVVSEQLALAIVYKPDVVLLCVGGNDSTHFTSGKSVQVSVQQIIDGLKEANNKVKIVVTRSPAVDSVTRFPWPIKQIMGLRTKQVNAAFAPVIQKNDLIIAPIAEKTREPFLKDPTLLAPDKFHPNARGYALWKPVINSALDAALASYKEK